MATLHPFRGLRYGAGLESRLPQLICPPYDVISPEQQSNLYAADPNNVIRLELPKETGPSRYAAAAATFESWRATGVLAAEASPAFYIYQQRFTIAGVTHVRRGVFAALQVEPWSTGRILPHEETLPSHKADRMQMLSVCQANFSPIFGLIEDPAGEVQGLLAAVAGGTPVADFETADGIRHTYWVVADSPARERLTQLAEPNRVFIADGHHRYETALEYRTIRRSAEPGLPAGHPVDYVLAFIVPLGDPGLIVLPTHRLLPGDGPAMLDRLLEGAKAAFEIEQVDLAGYPKAAAARYLALLESEPTPIRFGIYAGRERGFFDLRLRDAAVVEQVMPDDKSPAWRALDVAVLHRYLLEHVLGLAAGEAAGLTYTRDEQEAVEAVDRGAFGLAVFVRPASPDQVRAVATAGERMPEKSTYFFPKVPTGIVIRSLELI